MEDKEQFPKEKEVDINDTSLATGDEENINPESDAFESAVPPPDGTFKMKLAFARTKWVQKQTDAGGVFYQGNLEMRIEDHEEYANIPIFARVSTYVAAGKDTSTAATLLVKMGVKVPVKITHVDLARLFSKAIAKEPRLYVKGEWKAWDMSKEDWIKQGMKNFQQRENGTYNHMIKDSTGKMVSAKWKPVKWFGLKEWAEMNKGKEAPKKEAPKTVAPKKTEDDFDELIGEM